MQTPPALERERLRGNEIDEIRLVDMADDTLALLHCQYVDATVARSDALGQPFEFKIPREMLVGELERMMTHLDQINADNTSMLEN